MISPLPGVTATKPGSAHDARCPASSPTWWTTRAQSVPNGGGGYLVLREPWPSMLRTIWGDDKRFIETYWSRFEGMYFAGDGAKKDDDGAHLAARPGRRRDAGVRAQHLHHRGGVGAGVATRRWPRRRWSARPTRPPARRSSRSSSRAAARTSPARRASSSIAELRNHVAKTLGPIAKPRQIMLVPELPKTRSGKIMRRLLRDVAENRSLGDVTTLQDSSVMELISSGHGWRQVRRGLTTDVPPRWVTVRADRHPPSFSSRYDRSRRRSVGGSGPGLNGQRRTSPLSGEGPFSFRFSRIAPVRRTSLSIVAGRSLLPCPRNGAA